MWLGIPYLVWFGILGVIALFLTIPMKRKLSNVNFADSDEVSKYISSLNDIVEMRWERARVPVDNVTVLLNKIEVARITVMYQFFVREGKYDMFFRCRESQREDLKKILELK